MSRELYETSCRSILFHYVNDFTLSTPREGVNRRLVFRLPVSVDCYHTGPTSRRDPGEKLGRSEGKVSRCGTWTNCGALWMVDIVWC